MIYNNREVDCKVFSSSQDWKVRVVFGEDRTPYFCGLDVGTCLGYKHPTKAIIQSGLETTPRLIPWESGSRKGCTTGHCFDEANMVRFIRRCTLPIPVGFHQWIADVVIPGARSEAVCVDRVPELPIRTEEAKGNQEVLQRIDETILSLMLLKKALA